MRWRLPSPIAQPAESVRRAEVFKPKLPSLKLTIAVAIVYFAAGKFGLYFASFNPSSTPVWPPAGIALTALLLGGFQLWPAVLVGAFFVNLTTSGALMASLGIAAGNTLEAIVGTYLTMRFANGRWVL